MKDMMKNKKKISINYLLNNTIDPYQEFVVFGVIMFKSPVKTDSNNQPFCSWNIGHLKNENEFFKLLLFRNVYNEHSKYNVGSVIGILNVSKMDNKNNYKSDAYTVNNKNQIVILGESADIGFCKASKLDRTICKAIIDIRYGNYCNFHVQSAYKKQTGKRGVLNSSYSGIIPKKYSILNKLNEKRQQFLTKQEPKKQKVLSIENIKSNITHKDFKNSTLDQLNISLASDTITQKSSKEDSFCKLLSVSSIGSMNLVKCMKSNGNSFDKYRDKENFQVNKNKKASDLLGEYDKSCRNRFQNNYNKPVNKVDFINLNMINRNPIKMTSVELNRLKNNKKRKLSHLSALQSINGKIDIPDPNCTQRNKIKKLNVMNPEKDVDRKSNIVNQNDINFLLTPSVFEECLDEIEMMKLYEFFDKCEMEEKMLEKMSNITSVDCRIFICKECNYVAPRVSHLCKSKGHKVQLKKTQRRYFQCKNCNYSCSTILKYPINGCKYQTYGFSIVVDTSVSILPTFSLPLTFYGGVINCKYQIPRKTNNTNNSISIHDKYLQTVFGINEIMMWHTEEILKISHFTMMVFLPFLSSYLAECWRHDETSLACVTLKSTNYVPPIEKTVAPSLRHSSSHFSVLLLQFVRAVVLNMAENPSKGEIQNSETNILKRIDEAGRGPVLGPMVYGAAFCEIKDNVTKYGFVDSKTINESKRNSIFQSINQNSDIGWIVNVVSPNFLSNSQLSRTKYNLNTISHDCAINLVTLVIEKGINIVELYVDTVGDPVKYAQLLEKNFPRIKICVSKKADSKYEIVGAASICAKVIRDAVIKNWKFLEDDNNDLYNNFGSGYPNDPLTKAYLKKNLNQTFGFPTLVRFDWSTAKKIIDTSCVAIEW
ncbi:hypothetical protein A3Q56_00847 [Intoshia linei]|uniref:Ribonuclease n=1 Tax=Intoshia linei TaxID=1819745 RepID=A0A177BCX4_9BILA|nr:hypothetical protein A3Q56_00847 [Intoshia linei]